MSTLAPSTDTHPSMTTFAGLLEQVPTGDLADFWVHRLSVQPYLGSGTRGATWGDAQTVYGLLERKRRLVRDSAGEQTVSESTLYADASYADALPAKSKVTLTGRLSGGTWQDVTGQAVAAVLVCAVNDSGDLDLLDHLQVALQ